MGITFVDFFRDRLGADKATFHPARLVNVAYLTWQVRRERNRLATLSRAELAEMGIHPGDAAQEAARAV